MPTTSSKPASCKKCGKPGFQDATGKMQHEKRSDPNVFGGRRAEPGKQEKPKPEVPPQRDSILHKQVWGGKKEE